jgi:hypothetical protein
VVSLFLKDFHRESKPWSWLFKAGNNKILECMNGLKSRFFEKIDFFIFLKKLPKTIYFCKSDLTCILSIDIQKMSFMRIKKLGLQEKCFYRCGETPPKDRKF